MDTISVLAIAPYAGLKDQILKTTKKNSDLRVDVLIGNMEDSIRYKNLFYSGDYDVLLSRGGTANILRSISSIPVVEIEVSVYDMLRTIRMAQLSGEPFAIVGFRKITSSSRLICDILEYVIDIYEIQNEEEVLSCLSRLRESGINYIIGDVITVNAADRLGMSGLLVTSGGESIENAFREIRNLQNNIFLSGKNSGLYKTLLNRSAALVMLLDEGGGLLHANFSSDNFDLAGIETMLKDLRPRIPDSGSLRLLKRYKGFPVKIRAERFPFGGCLYNAFFIEKNSEGHALTKSCVTIENSGETFYGPSAGDIYNKDFMLPVISQARKIAALPAPVFICGQMGTGKDFTARRIHRSSHRKNAPFITIDCVHLTEKKWNMLVDDYQSPLNDTGYTLYFRGIHTLSLPIQKQILAYLEDTNLTVRHRVLSSSIYNINTLLSHPDCLPDLIVRLNGISLYVPSLNERIHDIPALTSQCINQYNIEFSRNVIGLEPAAMQHLMKFRWENNLIQFHQVLKQLVTSTEASYISKDQVRKLLSTDKPSAACHWIDLTGTLDEIETEVIKYVVSCENMNYSAAAKRLDISRSTVWRKLSAESANKKPQ